MFDGTFTEKDMLGMSKGISYSKEAPFPLHNIKTCATTVKKGKHVVVSGEWIPVPEIPKW